MKCTVLEIEEQRVIVCGSRRYKRCVGCGGPASRECDWKIAADKTCDAGVCARCTTSPAPDKDLCPSHAATWAEHPRNPQRATS